MTKFTEEIENTIFIDNKGEKIFKEYTVTYKDGVEVGRSGPHVKTILYDADVDQDVVDFIEAKKVKQPKKDN